MSYARRHSINVCPGNRVRYSFDSKEELLSHIDRIKLSGSSQ